MFLVRKMSTVILLVIAILFSFGSSAGATSWKPLDPAEVVSRASIVVLGIYDFSSEVVAGEDSLFGGVKFKVKKVYKGDGIGTEMTAGIDGFDIGWVEEFQQQGGEFLLFLENRASSPFPTPVSGPNGMVQIKDGIVTEQGESRQQYFNDYFQKINQEEAVQTKPVKLASAADPAPAPASETSSKSPIWSSAVPCLIILSNLFFIIIGLFFGSRLLSEGKK